jgi:hypothetical protein
MALSAFNPTADILSAEFNVCYVPTTDICAAYKRQRPVKGQKPGRRGGWDILRPTPCRDLPGSRQVSPEPGPITFLSTIARCSPG